MKNIAWLSRALISIVLLVCSISAVADTVQRVVYVNGIMTDGRTAQATAQRIKQILDNPLNHQGDTKKAYSVTNVWNPMGWSFLENSCTSGGNGTWDGIIDAQDPGACLYQDNIELMMLKNAEEWYMDSLEQLQSPHNAPMQWYAGAAALVAQYSDPMYNQTSSNNGLVMGFANMPDSMAALKQTIQNLEDAIWWYDPVTTEPTGSVIVVAHSQGNLLANLAYARVGADAGDPTKHIRVVNIANTSAISINNLTMANAGDAALYGKWGIFTYGLKTMAKDYYYAYSGPIPGKWRRVTPTCGDTMIPCEYAVDDSTFNAPDDDYDGSTTIQNHLMDTYIGCIALTAPIDGNPCEGYTDGLEHNHLVSAKDPRGVPYANNGHQRFRDSFEDLMYAAVASLDTANMSVPQGNYLTTNFSPTVPYFTEFSYGGSHYYDSATKTYTVSGIDMIKFTLPANVKTLDFTAHMKLIASDEQANQFGITVNGAGGPDRLFINLLHNNPICGSDGHHVLVMTADPSPWQCNINSFVDTNSFINAGWIKLHIYVDSVQCRVTFDITRDIDTYGVGFNYPLTPSQCANSRTAIRFSPGSPSNTASMVFDGLSISTSQ